MSTSSPDTLSLAGKTAIITGSGRGNGIGAAIARAFARNGAAVAIHHVSDSSQASADKLAASLAAEYGVRTTVVRGDVADRGVARRIVEDALTGLDVGCVDILVNNAGGAVPTQNLLEVTDEDIAAEFGTNVFSAIYMSQAVVQIGRMPPGGRIINVGSIASKTSTAGTALYNATKAAQDSLTTGLASDLGHSHGITVNTLAPGPIPTDTSKPFLESPDGPGSVMAKLARAAPRLGAVEDMADAALLLASEKSRWITAQWISVSGGVTGTM
ncbi:short chain dehydrogenase reductase [Xylariaceae sp. FL0594]|nr:short chain dehydrogenase reductase [Xylariaceae sp. FL0594]